MHDGGGPAYYEPENAWLAHNTPADKSKRGLERATADISAAGGLAGYNQTKSSMHGRKSARLVSVSQVVIRGVYRVVVKKVTGKDPGPDISDILTDVILNRVTFGGWGVSELIVDAIVGDDEEPEDPADMILYGGKGGAGGGGPPPSSVATKTKPPPGPPCATCRARNGPTSYVSTPFVDPVTGKPMCDGCFFQVYHRRPGSNDVP